MCGHRPFRVLAEHLTRAGLVVLRLDDRGVGGSTGNKDACTHAELLADIRAALAHLAGHPAVDPRRTGLIGHSEGAMLAAAAGGDSDVAFAVLLACGVGRGEDIVHEQSSAISRLDGATPEQVEHGQHMNRAVFAALRREPDTSRAEPAIRALLADHLRRWPGASAADPGDLADLDAHAAQLAEGVSTPAFRAFLACDASAYVRALRCPVLALYGALDVQIAAASHAPELRRILRETGHTDTTVEVLDGLNHLFQTAGSGAPSEYCEIEETLAPIVLERVASWLDARFAASEGV